MTDTEPDLEGEAVRVCEGRVTRAFHEAGTPRMLYHYKFYSETHLCFFLFFKKNSHYELVWSIDYNFLADVR